MSVLRKAALALGAFFVLILVVSLFLPSVQIADRSVVVHSPVARIFEQINKPKNWEHWIPEAPHAAELKYIYTGPEEGIGAAQTWEINGEQRVTFTITKSIPNEVVEFDMKLQGSRMKSTGVIVLEEKENGVEVTYRDIWELGRNPFYKYLGLAFDRAVGADLEDAAQGLKSYCEGRESAEGAE